MFLCTSISRVQGEGGGGRRREEEGGGGRREEEEEGGGAESRRERREGSGLHTLMDLGILDREELIPYACEMTSMICGGTVSLHTFGRQYITGRERGRRGGGEEGRRGVGGDTKPILAVW